MTFFYSIGKFNGDNGAAGMMGLAYARHPDAVVPTNTLGGE